MKFKHYINREKGTVVSRLVDTIDTCTWLNEAEEYLKKFKGLFISNYSYIYDIIGEFRPEESSNAGCTSVARCDDRDAFDEKTGIIVADSKAEIKYHTYMIKQYARMMKRLEKIYSAMAIGINDHENQISILKEKLEKFN